MRLDDSRKIGCEYYRDFKKKNFFHFVVGEFLVCLVPLKQKTVGKKEKPKLLRSLVNYSSFGMKRLELCQKEKSEKYFYTFALAQFAFKAQKLKKQFANVFKELKIIVLALNRRPKFFFKNL